LHHCISHYRLPTFININFYSIAAPHAKSEQIYYNSEMPHYISSAVAWEHPLPEAMAFVVEGPGYYSASDCGTGFVQWSVAFIRAMQFSLLILLK
jgi:hypothetical protein